MQLNDTILIRDLTASYDRQKAIYIQLRDMIRKLTSRLILSRGDCSFLQKELEKKQELLIAISNERTSAQNLILQWQERKKSIPSTQTSSLDAVLTATEQVIREFLDEEERLKKYLEGVMRKAAAQK